MDDPKLPALNPQQVEVETGTIYPAPFKGHVAGRERRRLGNALGLTNFGVNLTTLKPGANSALRHWHAKQDEFIYVLSGQLTLVTDNGEQTLTAGMAAGFPAGKPDAHCLVNRSQQDVVYLEVGDRTLGEVATYPDEDIVARQLDGRLQFFHKDGTPY